MSLDYYQDSMCYQIVLNLINISIKLNCITYILGHKIVTIYTGANGYLDQLEIGQVKKFLVQLREADDTILNGYPMSFSDIL